MKVSTSVVALLGALSVLAGCAGMPDPAGKRSLMITGNDEKVSWNDVGQVLKPGEKHSGSVVDIGTDPLAPKIIANSPHSAYFYNRNAVVVALKIDGKKVTRTHEVEVRGLPEGVVFSDDGRYVYVGNYNNRDVSILRVDGDQLVNTGRSLTLPGQPGSMRGKTLF